MRKDGLFTNDQLPRERAPEASNVISFTDAQLARMTPAERAQAAKGAPPRKPRWGLIPDNHMAIAKIKLARRPKKVDQDGNVVEVEDEDGDFLIRESFGARWIDIRFVLEGRYNNRFIFDRLMLQWSSEGAKAAGRETFKLIRDIRSTREHEPQVAWSKEGGIEMPFDIEGMRVPVAIWSAPRHGDGKLVNRVRVLSPIPSHPTSTQYEALGRKRKVKETVDLDTGRDKLVIDMPGWDLYPYSDLGKLYCKRLGEFHDQRIKASLRAIEKMKRKAAI